jgi:DNA helicase-2/ATP-dependent DNA helicase PcrA
MAFDLANRVPQPHGAACITLTNAAANELRRRIELLGVPMRSTIFVGTVHSFALRRIILPFAKLVGQPELLSYSIASNQHQDDAYRVAIGGIFRGDGDTRYVRSTIEFNRGRMADSAEWASASSEVVAVARRYEAILREQHLIDFDDLIAAAVEFVEQHRVVRHALTSRYPHFYVDEYQDLSPGLHRLVLALCFDYAVSSELFAVGDPDQAVFGWTGARPELLRELAECSGVTPVHLEHNYRCGEEIIRVANLMRSGAVPMRGSRDGGHVSAIRCPGGYAEQCQRAIGVARSALERGTPLHEIVVICPSNALCEEAADAFRRAGVPAFVRGTEYRLTELTGLIEGCAAWICLGREKSGYRLSELLRSWRAALGPNWSREADAALTGVLINFASRTAEPAVRLFAELESAGLRYAMKQSSRADDAVELRKMRDTLSEGGLSGLSVAGLAEIARKTERVEVTTMTSSKGLEFDTVLILGADQKWVPDFRSIGNVHQLAEDRRKFYVSVTRARHEVRIFYSGFVVWRNGRKDYAGPSMFLREIGLV